MGPENFVRISKARITHEFELDGIDCTAVLSVTVRAIVGVVLQ